MTPMALKDRRIIVAVTGSIAAYRAAELVRLLIKTGAQVRVVMTSAAQSFVTPMTFQALSGNRVHTDLFDAETEAAMDHIQLARWADSLLIAPASANCLAQLAQGMANDLLSTLYLATTARVFIAPAMNHCMWEHEATQANIRVLRERQAHILGPARGEQACGETGLGRMLMPEQIVANLVASQPKENLAGVKILINAGPTQEPIDPVRYISNHSSGKMGYAIAKAAIQAGAQVSLVSGPTQLAPPAGARFIEVVTAQDMRDATLQLVGSHDIFIAAAAVGDFSAAQVADQKIKKTKDGVTLALTKNEDILATVGQLDNGPFTVGFAAETQDLQENALRKLQEKQLDMIAANWVGQADSGFGSDHNALSLYWTNGHVDLPNMSKAMLAVKLMDVIARRYEEKLFQVNASDTADDTGMQKDDLLLA